MIIKIIVPTSIWACATLHSLGTVLCMGLLKLCIWRGCIAIVLQVCRVLAQWFTDFINTVLHALPTCHDSAVPWAFVRRYLELDEHTGTLVIWNQRPPLSLVYKIEDWAAADSQVGQELRTWIVKWCWMTLDDVGWCRLLVDVELYRFFSGNFCRPYQELQPKATWSLVAVIRTRTTHFHLN